MAIYTCLLRSQGIHSGKLPPAEALGSRKGRLGALMGSLVIRKWSAWCRRMVWWACGAWLRVHGKKFDRGTGNLRSWAAAGVFGIHISPSCVNPGGWLPGGADDRITSCDLRPGCLSLWLPHTTHPTLRAEPSMVVSSGTSGFGSALHWRSVRGVAAKLHLHGTVQAVSRHR